MSDHSIFDITTRDAFAEKALQLFHKQYNEVEVYREYCDHLHIAPRQVGRVEQIPFLPIEFFKTRKVVSKGSKAEAVFSSSGTTGEQRSKHLVADLSLYRESFLRNFEATYGPTGEMSILALLPGYMERKDASLLYMVNELIERTRSEHSGFYLNDHQALLDKIHLLESMGRRTILIGVSFALLDLVERHRLALNHTLVMETGGMKGRRKELIRAELHKVLRAGFGLAEIHSEYGMTELLSQAYSRGSGIFYPPPWMQVLSRDPEDPFSLVRNRTGGINIIDLANQHSCCFIATQDLGRVYEDGSFEILGRFDTSDIRGCNLMML